MKITISTLRQAFNKLINHLEGEGITEVNINHDYYWDIPEDQLYDVTKKPKEMDIGQLSDDWNELENIIRGKNEAIGYALVWLAAILRAVGQEKVR